MAFTNTHGRTQTSLAEINVTPFVDVVLVLLIIFMITAPVIQSGIQVDLPQTREVKQVTQEGVTITIDARERIYIGSDPVNINDLVDRVRKLRKSPAQAVYLRCDRKVAFGQFAMVLDRLKSGGVPQASVVTRPYEAPRK